MTWRHFLLAAAVLAMFIVNGVLLFFEDVNLGGEASGPVDRIVDPLLVTVYAPARRLDNFKAFGLPEDLAEDAASRARVIYNDNERLRIMLAEQPELLSQFFCPTSGVPERYSALHVLVEQDEQSGGFIERDVIRYDRVTSLDIQDWEANSLVGQVYNDVELTTRRRPDSTAMGVGAVLTVRETDLFERNAPFGNINWRFGRLRSNHADLDAKIAQYFALMHVLTEIAREPETGICRG